MAKRQLVYLAICRDSAGLAFFKIGVTDNPQRRVANLRVGCPLPFTAMFVSAMGTRADALRAENALHKKFRDRWVSGEWFSFRPSSDVDLHLIDVGCKEAFASVDTGWAGWETVSMDTLPTRARGTTYSRFQPHQDYSSLSRPSGLNMMMHGSQR